jgi:hypothetical protein
MWIELTVSTITNRSDNYTRDAVQGIAEQLGPTSTMAWEHALDMILAEKVGEGGGYMSWLGMNVQHSKCVTIFAAWSSGFLFTELQNYHCVRNKNEDL